MINFTATQNSKLNYKQLQCYLTGYELYEAATKGPSPYLVPGEKPTLEACLDLAV